MTYDFLYDKHYQLAIVEKRFHFFGNVGIPTPGWNGILHAFDKEIQHKHVSGEERKRIKPFVQMDNYGFIIHGSVIDLPHVREFATKLAQSSNSSVQWCSAYAFISFSSMSQSYTRHKDKMDVWCWQAVGKSVFTIDEEDSYFQTEMRPGDLIYIPRGTHHHAKPLGPRATISFGNKYN